MKFVGPSKSATAHKPSCNVAKDSVSQINLKMNLSRPLHLSGGPWSETIGSRVRHNLQLDSPTFMSCQSPICRPPNANKHVLITNQLIIRNYENRNYTRDQMNFTWDISHILDYWRLWFKLILHKNVKMFCENLYKKWLPSK